MQRVDASLSAHDMRECDPHGLPHDHGQDFIQGYQPLRTHSSIALLSFWSRSAITAASGSPGNEASNEALDSRAIDEEMEVEEQHEGDRDEEVLERPDCDRRG